MSFTLTIEPFKNRTKTVTRRKGWRHLKVGDVVMGCTKCMGLKKGEKIEKMGLIKIRNVRIEPLNLIALPPYDYGEDEMLREGFPGLSVFDFMDLFKHQGIKPEDYVTRIEFEYL